MANRDHSEQKTPSLQLKFKCFWEQLFANKSNWCKGLLETCWKPNVNRGDFGKKKLLCACRMLSEKQAYPPTAASFVFSSWRAASSVLLSKSTFCWRLRKCISCNIDALFLLFESLEITTNMFLSGLNRSMAAPIPFWNSLCTDSCLALKIKKLTTHYYNKQCVTLTIP